MSHAIFCTAYWGTGKHNKSNMSTTSFPLVLQQPIKELPFSETFILRCKLMEFSTLAEIIATKEKEVMAHKEFNYIWFNELLDYLNKYDLLYLMEGKQRF